ncbi:hypothetical protein pb186bvf_003254 [Paramecium bursaria]
MQMKISKRDNEKYTAIYSKIQSKGMELTYKNVLKLLIQNFQLTQQVCGTILDKVLKKYPHQPLGQNAFFMCLKYVQAIQNNYDIETCDIFSIKPQNPLQTNTKNVEKANQEQDEQNRIKNQQLLNQITQSQDQQPNMLMSKIQTQQELKQIVDLVEALEPSSQSEETIQKQDSIPEINKDQTECKQNNEQQLEQSILNEENNQKQRKSQEIQIKVEQNEIIELSNFDDDDIKWESKKTLEITIDGFEKIKESYFDFKGHFLYKIKTIIRQNQEDADEKILRTVQRRYNDFVILDGYFKSKYQAEIQAILPEKQFFQNNDSLAENRKERLEMYLKKQSEIFSQDKIFLYFLIFRGNFEIVLEELKQTEEKSDFFVPDPHQQRYYNRIKETLSNLQQESIKDKIYYTFIDVQIDERFRDKIKIPEQFYKELQQKYNDLQKLEQNLIQFYTPIPKYQYQQQESATCDQQIQILMNEIQKTFLSLCGPPKNPLTDMIKGMKYFLACIIVSYQDLINELKEWSKKNIKLNTNPQSTQLQKDDLNIKYDQISSHIEQMSDNLNRSSIRYKQYLNELLDSYIIQLCELDQNTK